MGAQTQTREPTPRVLYRSACIDGQKYTATMLLILESLFSLARVAFSEYLHSRERFPMPVQDGVLRFLLPSLAIVWLCTKPVVLLLSLGFF